MAFLMWDLSLDVSKYSAYKVIHIKTISAKKDKKQARILKEIHGKRYIAMNITNMAFEGLSITVNHVFAVCFHPLWGGVAWYGGQGHCRHAESAQPT